MTPSRGRHARVIPHGRRHHRHWLALLVLPPLLIGVGTVFLAGNFVPPTSAGVVATSPAIPTRLAFNTPVLSESEGGYSVALSATLTADGSGLGGQTLMLGVGSASCTAETATRTTSTASLGVASCTISGLSSLPTSATASFAGNGPLERSSATETESLHA